MFTAALVISVAANVGLLFYIIAEQALDKWEKKDASSSTHRGGVIKSAAHLYRPQNEQE